MQTAALIKSYIYVVSSSLLYPVLVLLALLTFWVVACGGALFSEWFRRKRVPDCLAEEALAHFSASDHSHHTTFRVGRYVSRLKEVLARRGETTPLEVERLLQRTTGELLSSLDVYRLVVRVGPGLGLIGTLIPMGTGLAALGKGDLSMLSSELVIAFTTTVVGMAVGLCAFLFLILKNRWVDEDLLEMEVATEILAGSLESTEPLESGLKISGGEAA